MKKTSNEIREESKALFLERFNGQPKLNLQYFHTFLCPVAFAEAMVKEHIIEDYDALELLVLRLYAAGFHKIEDIVSLSGMKDTLIERAMNNEINVYQHIDFETGQLTDMGLKTLAENENGNYVSHVMYDTPRRLQIEAATGTVIPSYLEEDNIKYLRTILDERSDGVVPRESVRNDEELQREINDRIKEYKHMDILNEGDTIVSVESLNTTELYYRYAYLVRFEGMEYPMIAMQGKKTISNVNADSIKKKDYGNKVVVPIAISRTDADYLRENDMIFDDVLIRDDNCFEYLLEKTKDFKFDIEQNEIQLENEMAIYEDEKLLETEDVSEDASEDLVQELLEDEDYKFI